MRTTNTWRRLLETVTEGPTVTFTLPRAVAKDLLVALGESLEVDIDLDALADDGDDMGDPGMPDGMEDADVGMDGMDDVGMPGMDAGMDDLDGLDDIGDDDVPAGEPDDDDDGPAPAPKKKGDGGKGKGKDKDDKDDGDDDDDDKKESSYPSPIGEATFGRLARSSRTVSSGRRRRS